MPNVEFWAVRLRLTKAKGQLSEYAGGGRGGVVRGESGGGFVTGQVLIAQPLNVTLNIRLFVN